MVLISSICIWSLPWEKSVGNTVAWIWQGSLIITAVSAVVPYLDTYNISHSTPVGIMPYFKEWLCSWISKM